MTERRSGTEPFSLDGHYLTAGADGTMAWVAKQGPPPRIDGLTLGLHHLTSDSAHRGELHPDGEELLVVLTGAVTVELLHADQPPQDVVVHAGHGFVVPRGVWHRLRVDRPTTLLHATPGPAFDVRW